jgi:hypothetical protein
MTKATDFTSLSQSDAELYPALAAYLEDGGRMTTRLVSGLWYVSVENGTEPGLSVTLASRDLDYALRQADIVSGSWVMA